MYHDAHERDMQDGSVAGVMQLGALSPPIAIDLLVFIILK